MLETDFGVCPILVSAQMITYMLTDDQPGCCQRPAQENEGG